jgi:hypothetical protein
LSAWAALVVMVGEAQTLNPMVLLVQAVVWLWLYLWP